MRMTARHMHYRSGQLSQRQIRIIHGAAILFCEESIHEPGNDRTIGIIEPSAERSVFDMKYLPFLR